MQYRGKVDFAHERKVRDRNTRVYRLCHWPIWIWVFFLSPGPLTFSLFAHGFHLANGLWLSAVLVGTGIAGLRGRLPGAEPRPYILRFDEDKPNPLYRRICYTFAWNAVLNFARLNLAGLLGSALTGVWRLKPDLHLRLFPALRPHPASRRPGQAAPHRPLHQKRRPRAPLLLRLRLGRHRRANPSAHPLEDPAPHPRRRSNQTSRLCGYAPIHGPAGPARQALPHPSHPPRRTDDLRLIPTTNHE